MITHNFKPSQARENLSWIQQLLNNPTNKKIAFGVGLAAVVGVTSYAVWKLRANAADQEKIPKF